MPGFELYLGAALRSLSAAILPSVKHHFGDFLDRDGHYWTIVPNRERYAHAVGDTFPGSPATVVTLGKNDSDWKTALSLPNLEELTLHEPSPEQLDALAELSQLKRLRITHARPRALEFLAPMKAVEELVLEYVSGVDDLSPLGRLPRLRALHLENLRRVRSFAGLAGSASLRYLSIYGTLDWKQPIDDFAFLRGLPGLEVLGMFRVITRAPYPALLPAVGLKRLLRLKVHGGHFDTAEYALLEEGLPGVEGASWGPWQLWPRSFISLPADDPRAKLNDDVLRERHPEVRLIHDGTREIADPDNTWFEFTGKGAGHVKATSPAAEAKCRAVAARYEELKERARRLLGAT